MNRWMNKQQRQVSAPTIYEVLCTVTKISIVKLHSLKKSPYSQQTHEKVLNVVITRKIQIKTTRKVLLIIVRIALVKSLQVMNGKETSCKLMGI